MEVILFRSLKRIKLGTGFKSGDEIIKALKTANVKMTTPCDGSCEYILKFLPISPIALEVELVVVSPADLGFKILDTKDGPTLKDIYSRALDVGLELCPAEVGPQLRLQFLDQPKHEVVKDENHGWNVVPGTEQLKIAMETKWQPPGCDSHFTLTHAPWGKKNPNTGTEDFLLFLTYLWLMETHLLHQLEANYY